MDSMPLPSGSRLWKSKADFFRPFRTAAASEAGENITPLYDPSQQRHVDEEPDLRDLNTALVALTEVFPDVEPETFREMLLGVSEQSRVAVVTEQLLKRDARSEPGRHRLFGKQRAAETVVRKRSRVDSLAALPAEETFRSEGYKKAVKLVLYQEFRNLSHSSIKAVMAEQNHSYSRSRTVLQQLAQRFWRFSLSSFWTRRSPSQTASEHPHIMQSGSSEAGVVLGVKRTGSAQLDQELYELFVETALLKQKRDQLTADLTLALKVNETEAEEAQALFDCECCYGSVPFEQLAVCDDACHQLCFDCIQRSVNEALYGQGWSRTVDLSRSTVRCFAPATHECSGSLAARVVRRALAGVDHDEETWHIFQGRVSNEALIKSRLPLQRCPFCSYAEVDEVPSIRLRSGMDIWKHIATRSSAALQIMLLSLSAALFIFTVPLILLATVIWILVNLVPPLGAILDASHSRVHRHRRGPKFKCQDPKCQKVSCIRCTSLWRDPHVCFESEKTSLRTAIESSATAAVKRTCPKCLLSFVKSSGCNKLVCNCGYTMCYICRQEITSKEGYSHFCQHFRPSGGRCGECERCDLYGDEDEEAAIRKAAEGAEKDWREKEGGKEGDERAMKLMVDALVGQARHGRWYERYLDALVDAAVA